MKKPKTMTIRSKYFRLIIKPSLGCGYNGELIANGNDGFGVSIEMRLSKTLEQAKREAESLLTNITRLFKSRAEFDAIREWVDNPPQRP
jgi:hypothetical protein